MHNKVLNKITDNSIVLIALMSIPLNIIIYFAIRESQYQLPRYIPPFLGLTSVVFVFIRNRIGLSFKIWSFIFLLFLTGCYSLLLGLIDVASLWFVLAIIYSLFISKKNEALLIFIASFLAVLIVGILMITKISFIPLQYNFLNCQFACVAVRILHFLLIGLLVYYILNVFFSTIQGNVKELQLNTGHLENLNIALNREMIEKKAIQQKMIDVVILTEEKERKRLASDLHDGLGPVLAAINLYFQAYIDAANNNSKREIESKLKTIIDNAIKDVSRISHNISPHILEKHGLIAALTNLITPMKVCEKIQFNFDCCETKRLDTKEELIIYRAIAELINNTLKHSDASQIFLKLKTENNLLNVYYEDNGKGFDVDEELRSNSGMGLNNIQNRINTLNGKIIFESSCAKGMKAHLMIPYIIKNEN
ncbi:hypothetical protein D4R75_12630 [bacterium]|nr:MAG: hypothetical protein D4R75_12630 [bacterium]